MFSNFYLPNDLDKPPTLYAIMNSIVNFGEVDKTKIKDLAHESRTKIFDFTYPLSSNFDKESFEENILNNFIQRRIGFETFNMFKIKLRVKLNEIMPYYNKLIDSYANWNLFNDGESVTESSNLNKNTNINTSNNTSASDSSNTNVNASNISDKRFSDTPQTNLNDVRDGSYVSEYNYDTDSGTSNTNTNGTSTSNATSSSLANELSTNTKRVSRTEKNKINIYKDYLEMNKYNIMTMIYKDLECLFYSLID